ncbi:hypothetical protein GCK72_012330 [Caenorhabditis remanei]|uniref:Uncharacterized protein n=1 Tax=Caenorhabditis remanei TaxID=31234 RepID=A0A6A5GKM4_CAERE|nr:hypothetical protein GCK72_012330 [Caenorhabditis remanei]KAF1755877.1 hypothetical protein GCK72_012330 [Caenorhabditis remanei]
MAFGVPSTLSWHHKDATGDPYPSLPYPHPWSPKANFVLATEEVPRVQSKLTKTTTTRNVTQRSQTKLPKKKYESSGKSSHKISRKRATEEFESSSGVECKTCDEQNGICVVSDAVYSCVLTIPVDSLEKNTAANTTNSNVISIIIYTIIIVTSLQLIAFLLIKNRGKMLNWINRRFRRGEGGIDAEKGEANEEVTEEVEKEAKKVMSPSAPMYPSLEAVEESGETGDFVESNNEIEQEDVDEITDDLDRVAAWLD